MDTQDFDVILMDIRLPGQNGYEITKELRRKGFSKPIIALTGNAMPEEKQKSLEAGCDAHLTKPLNARLLFRTLKELKSGPYSCH